MNTTAMLKSAAEHGGPIAMTAGVAALTAAIVGVGHGQVAAQPRPTVTVTTTRTVEAPVHRTSTPRPTASTPASAVTVVAAQESRSGASSAREGASGAPSGVGNESAGSTPPATPASCSGSVLAAHLPLGVLPHCALTVGGN